jgi:hypothetical protein
LTSRRSRKVSSRVEVEKFRPIQLHHCHQRDALRPDSIPGANDQAQLGELSKRERAKGVQVTCKCASVQGVSEEEILKHGTEEKSKEFVEEGAEVYAKA